MTENGRGGLQDSPFSFCEGAGGKVFVSWRGGEVMVLIGHRAKSFLDRIVGMDDAGQQLMMAKETGNFKRGNER